METAVGRSQLPVFSRLCSNIKQLLLFGRQPGTGSLFLRSCW